MDDAIAQRLLGCLTCIEADPKDPASFDAMSKQLGELEAARNTGGNRLFYLATPPNAFLPISRELGRTGMLAENGAWRRLVVEKPFGTDLASAKALNSELLKLVDEHEIYRIDHYLGKETVQNILVLRFANGMFEPIWNRNHIDHVQITVDETARRRPSRQLLRPDRRAARHGAEPSVSTAVAGRDGAADPLRRRIRCARKRPTCSPRSRSRARPRRCGIRCAASIWPAGSAIARSRTTAKIEDVAAGSTTETYAALKLVIDNWRWAGVPFYLRTGKALGVKRTEVAIKFKQAPFAMFNCTPVEALAQNYLVIGVAPNEGIALQFNTKVPGPSILIDGVEMKFRYKDYFKAEPSTGYETLIYDCMIGDNILFQRADSVEAGWKAVQPFIDAWKKAGAEGLQTYKAGSEGPEEANELVRRDGRSWRKLG